MSDDKVVNLRKHRGIEQDGERRTLNYEPGDIVEALRWVMTQPGPASQLEAELHALLTEANQENADRVRAVLYNSLWYHKEYGP